MIYFFMSIFMLIVIFVYINCLIIKKENIDHNLFEGAFFNLIHILSYSIPLKYFMKNENELSLKEQRLNEKLKKLNLDNKFSIRTYMALRFILFFSVIVIYFVVVLCLKNIKGNEFSIFNTFNYLAVCMLIPLIPDLFLKAKEKEFTRFYEDQAVLLQLLLILMIRSNATIEDVLFAFSKMNTFYKKTFEKAYRTCLRNKKEALIFLENEFKEYEFGNTFAVLNDMHEYSKEDSIRILETNMRLMEDENLNKKRKQNLSKFAYAQISVVVPFLIVVFLGAIPIIHYGVNMMTSVVGGL